MALSLHDEIQINVIAVFLSDCASPQQVWECSQMWLSISKLARVLQIGLWDLNTQKPRGYTFESNQNVAVFNLIFTPILESTHERELWRVLVICVHDGWSLQYLDISNLYAIWSILIQQSHYIHNYTKKWRRKKLIICVAWNDGTWQKDAVPIINYLLHRVTETFRILSIDYPLESIK